MAAASAAGQHNGTHHAARRLRLNLDGGLANLLKVLGEKVVGELANVLVHSACLAHGACLNAAQHSTHAHTSERDLPPRAAARRAASQAAMLVLRPPGGHCCLSVRRRASISQAGTSAKRVRASTHKMQKVMSRAVSHVRPKSTSNTRSPRRSVTSATVSDHRRVAQVSQSVSDFTVPPRAHPSTGSQSPKSK